MLETAKAEEQCLNRSALESIISALLFLVQQGLAIRGHESDEGNYVNLLKLNSNYNEPLNQWLRGNNATKYISLLAQNELLSISSRHLLQKIISDFKDEPFSVICDGTRDCAGDEQKYICVR